MEVKITTNANEKLTMNSTDIKELPCVKCLVRPICSNVPVNGSIKCHILAEFIREYSETKGFMIEVTDLISVPLQRQLLYIYNKANNGSSND